MYDKVKPLYLEADALWSGTGSCPTTSQKWYTLPKVYSTK